MKFGDTTILRIDSVDKKGRGRGQVNGREACVPFAVPGEEVEASLTARRQGILRLQLERVLSPSPKRVEPRCKYAGKCGGCAWQQFDYGYQLELKRELINAAFAKTGMTDLSAMSSRPNGRIAAIEPAPSIYYYRNRMDYCVGPKGELGLKEPGRWNAWLDLDTCFLLSPESVEVMRIFRSHMKKYAIAPWDGQRYTGYARYLVIREGKSTSKRMATIVTSAGPLPGADELVSALAPLCTTVYHGVNDRQTDVSTADTLTLLHGDELLEERVDGRTFLIPPNSFFQTNTEMAGRLLATVRGFLSESRPARLLDLYCGVGFFGISLADSADRVLGVELDADAAAIAERNAERNGVTNAEFISGAAEALAWERETPDAVIVDPPRSGLHPKVIRTLLDKSPGRIVYVSCNYESFARDFRAMSLKYRIAKIAALDLFPHSPHAEVIALLEKAKTAE